MLAYIKKRRRARGSVQGLRVCNFTIKKELYFTNNAPGPFIGP